MLDVRHRGLRETGAVVSGAVRGGTLYVVATPIGNLRDVTLRALEILRAVDVIACEDTRQTSKLLRRHGIGRPMISLHEHNERARAPALTERLVAGESIALVSDGGTPLISDPGWRLAHESIARGVALSWIPGPTALIGALVLSGLPTDRFVFEGFLPARPLARRKRLAALKEETRTVVIYESPHRLLKALRDISEVLGDVEAACVRELTKAFEEVRRGSVNELIGQFERRAPRGECVVVFRARSRSRAPSPAHA